MAVGVNRKVCGLYTLMILNPSRSTHIHSIADPLGDRSARVRLSCLCTNVARPYFLLYTEPASVKLGITSRSELVECVPWRRIMRVLCLLASWLMTQILFALRPSIFSCITVGTNHSWPAPVVVLFFRGRGSILLPPRKHPC